MRGASASGGDPRGLMRELLVKTGDCELAGGAGENGGGASGRYTDVAAKAIEEEAIRIGGTQGCVVVRRGSGRGRGLRFRCQEE